MGRKVVAGEESEQGIIQMDAGAGLHIVAYALRNGRVSQEEAGCQQYLEPEGFVAKGGFPGGDNGGKAVLDG